MTERCLNGWVLASFVEGADEGLGDPEAEDLGAADRWALRRQRVIQERLLPYSQVGVRLRVPGHRALRGSCSGPKVSEVSISAVPMPTGTGASQHLLARPPTSHGATARVLRT